MKDFLRIATFVLGYGLIIGGFILLGGDTLEQRILVLDIVAACAVFTLVSQYLIVPFIDTRDRQGRGVGMLGLNLFFLNVCAVASILIIIGGIVGEWQFKYQLMAQIAVLLVLCLGGFLTLHAGDKVAQVHQSEQRVMAGKASMRDAAAQLLNAAEMAGGVDAAIIARLRQLSDDTRYLSPSANTQAMNLEDVFCQTADQTADLLVQPEGAQQALQLIARLERTLQQRKRVL